MMGYADLGAVVISKICDGAADADPNTPSSMRTALIQITVNSAEPEKLLRGRALPGAATGT